ncbi:MAG: hypothetical protein AAGU11_20280 [Syntrophobacteraceae bacterium]
MGTLPEVVEALLSVAGRIRQIEAEAADALFIRDNREEYIRLLEEKAMLLIELPERVGPLLEGVEEAIGREIAAGAEDFSRRATPAFELSSPFYMSALLYPDDHAEGQPNDLELFIERIRSKYPS